MKSFLKIVFTFAIILIVSLIIIDIVPIEKFLGISFATITFYVFIALFIVYLVALLTFIIINRRKKIIEIVEFSAPNDMTPADAGFVIDKIVDNKDVSSLLIYWAQKKYLSIINQDEKTIIFKKLKNSDENMKEYEKIFFDTMFAKNDEVNLNQLPEIISPISNQLVYKIKEENTQKYFSSKVTNISICFTLAITSALIFISYFLGNGGNFSIYCGLVIFLISTIFSKISSKVYTDKRIKGIIPYLSGIVLFLILAIINLLFSFTSFYSIILISVASLLCLITYILCPLIEYRNENGKKVLGSLLGLKHYIEVAEKEKIEKLVQDEPELFYSVLPYAYVLNISNKWIEQFNFVKIIDKKNKKELYSAIGCILVFCILGESFSILSDLLSGFKTKKSQK